MGTAPGKIVVVGGGLIGVASSWYLRKAGWQVTVIDRKTIGGACSSGNCGLICPSHVLPLTEPGAFKEAIKALLSRNAPFRIQPRVDPALWSWLWNFAKRCNRRSMIQAAHAIQALLTSALQEYNTWVHHENIECEWQAKGLLYAYRTQKELDGYQRTNDLLSEMFDEPARRLSSDEMHSIEPALKPSLAGGWLYEHDAHLRPDTLLASLRSRLEDDGVQFVEHCELKGIQGKHSQAVAIDTNQGEWAADAFLFASGAWTPLLSEQLGCRIPIEPGKGYSLTMPRPKVCPELPIIFPEHRVVVTPMQSGYRLGSIMEFAGYDESIRPERLQLLRQGAEHYLQEPYCEPELQMWYGWRPMTYDSLPVIDRSPHWGNVWVAAGHNMLGLSMAPSTGKLVSELVNDLPAHIDPQPYAIDRFSSS